MIICEVLMQVQVKVCCKTNDIVVTSPLWEPHQVFVTQVTMLCFWVEVTTPAV